MEEHKSISAPRFSLKTKQSIKKLLPIVVVVLLILGVIRLATSRNKIRSTSSDQRADIQAPKATMEIKKEYQFPVLDNAGKELTKIKLVIDTATLRDEIIVQGRRVVAVRGKTYLIVSVKLTNDYDKALEVNVKNYLRLTVNGNTAELFAPQIHNDPVTVDPSSTKPTRIGFPINDTDANLVLLVGEPKGDKDQVSIAF